MAALQIGFVGLAGRGGTLARRTVDLGYDIAAGADVDADARASFADAHGARTYESHEELLATADLDALVVATPNVFHAPVAVAALDAGVDVLVEKPLADTLEAAESVARAEQASDAFGMVGFQRRFTNTMRAVKAHVDAGRLGEVTHVEVNYARRRGIPGGAKASGEFGGGALLDVGVHIIDLALYFLEFPDLVEAFGSVRSDFLDRDDVVTRSAGPPEDAGGAEDTARGTLRAADGTTVAVTATWAQHHPADHGIHLWGTEAGASLPYHGGDITFYEESTTGPGQLVESVASVEENDPAAAELECFFEAARAGRPPGTNTIAQGVAVQRAMDGIYRSAERGRAVEIG